MGTGAVRRRTLLLVEDQAILRLGLVQIISKEPDLAICGEASHPAEAMAFLDRTIPDLILTDLDLRGRGGIQFVEDLRARFPQLPILILSMSEEGLHAERALKAGAQGYLMKDVGGKELLVAIRKVLDGGIYLSPRMTEKVLTNLGRGSHRGATTPVNGLTEREFQVFQMIGLGKTAREIAAELGLSSKTVDVHRGHIRWKLKLSDSTALIHHATQWMEAQRHSTRLEPETSPNLPTGSKPHSCRSRNTRRGRRPPPPV